MMTEQILACPFCGNELLETYDDGESYYVFCSSCGAQGPLSKDKSDAILLWNAAANQLAAKNAEIAEHRNHVAKIMQRENNMMKHNEKLRAEIAQLLGENSRLKRANESMVEEKHRHYIAWQAEIKKVAAGDKRQDELEAEIEKLREKVELYKGRAEEYTSLWTEERSRLYDRIEQIFAERDEARRVARVLYNERNAMSLGLDTIKRHVEKSIHDGVPITRLSILGICKAGLENLSYTRNEPPTSRVDATESDA